MKWKVYIRQDDFGWEYYCREREEALIAAFIALDKLEQGRKDVRISYSYDGQKSWNLDCSFVIK